MTTSRFLLLLALLLALEAPAAAQTVRADRVTLNAGPCVITSGSAAPNGSRIGNVCDTFIQTTSGAIWTKTSGTGTSSGWIATLAGTGTPGTLPVWTSASAIGDSIIAQAGGVATITGSATITGTGTMATEHVTGNSTIGGTASITGAATLGSVLDVSGVTTLRSDTSISGNTVLGGWIGSLGYASQVSGWRITAAGAADVRYLFTDELRAKLFTADAESVLAGSMRVTKSYSTVAQPFTCPAASSTSPLWVYDASTYGDAPVFQANDFVVIHVLTRAAFGPFTITDCVGQVSAYADGAGANAGQQQWTFTRAAGSNGGAMTASTVVAVNQLVQDLGVSGNGYVELSAVDGAAGSNAPYIQTNTWATSPTAANTTTNCRLGNLNGLTALGDYGLLCGAFVTNGPFFWMSTRGIEMRNLALTMFDNGTQVFTVDPHAGSPLVALGNPLPTTYASGNAGLWAGKDTDGTYKLRIGNPTGNRLTWNGSQLSIAGEGSGITNINGGNIQAGTISAAQLSITAHPGGASISPDPNPDDSSLWADQSGGAYPPALLTTISDGVVGTKSMRSQTGRQAVMGSSYYWPLDIRKTYRAHVWVRASAGATGGFYVQMSAVGNSGGASAYLGTFSLGLQNLPVSTTWAEYTAILPPGVLPAATTNVNWYVVMNNGSATPVGYLEFQDLRFEEAVPSTLIKDGAITTNKIFAGSITGDKIAANTITVGNLNATGFGDNLIKNSTFEGSDNPTRAIDGWIADPQSTGSILYGCCGTRGPGALVLQASAGQANVLASYLAVPVQIGIPYRVAMDIYTGNGTAAGVYIYAIESQSYATPRHIVSTGAPTAPDVLMDTITTLYTNGPIIAGWQHFEFTYTPPSPVRWVSVGIHNYTCSAGGATCQPLYVDAVEMQPQLGSGHIRAASITADRLVANSITAAQIAGGTITATQIAGGTITGAQIAARTIISGNIVSGTLGANEIAARSLTADRLVANTITSNEIGVRAIVAGNLAANTITAAEIAAGTITADRMNVGALSAITANLGAVNAGSLNAVTITGSTITGTNVTAGCATMNSNGITLSAGSGACNWYKFSNGTLGMYSDGGAWMYVQGPNLQLMGTSSGAYINLISDATLVGPNSVVLNSNNNQIHLTQNGYIQLAVSSLSNTAQGFHLCVDANNYIGRCT